MNIVKINKWLKDNDFDTKCCKGNDIYYNQCIDEIYLCDDDNGESFHQFFQSKLKHNFSINTESLLHELGHAETLDDMSDFKCLFNEYITKVLEEIKYFLDNHNITLFDNFLENIYFRLPAESAATNWAVDFIKCNYEEVVELNKYV